MIVRRFLPALVIMAAAVLGESASWWDVRQADAQMDLVRARAEALEVIKNDSQSAEAVAVASWWLGTLDSLPGPEEILETVTFPINPELAFILGLIESELSGLPPAGTLTNAELSGPWGTFGRLDLRRGVVPADTELPPLGTPWNGPGTQYRIALVSEDGRITVPPSLQLGGVVLAAWTIEAADVVDAYLVVEAYGDINLEVDGIGIDEIRFAGVGDPGVTWYRVHLAPGLHRFRAAMAPQGLASVRLSLFDDEAGPAILPRFDPEGQMPQWAGSTLTEIDPPTPDIDISDRGAVPELLRAVEVARIRRDVPLQRKLLNQAIATAPDEPMVNLAFAAFSLLEPTGEAPEVAAGRAADHLRRCGELPIAGLVERLLAMRQNRIEDVERLQEKLIEDHPSDVRVLRLRITQAVHRGWPQEAADALEGLERTLGATESVQRLRLQVLEGLEHWAEYRNALHSLAAQAPLRRDHIVQLAEGCSTEEAVKMIDRLRSRVRDPDLDADRIRLLLRSEHHDEARRALDQALNSWGILPDLGVLDLSLALGSVEAEHSTDAGTKASINRVLASHPTDLDLKTLAWRRGFIEPFWEAFHVDASDIAKSSSVSEEGVDVVLLLDQAVERVFPDGSSLYYYHGLSKALTPAGARQASSLEQMPGAVRITLAIIKPDGRKIVPAEITPTSRGISLGEVESGDMVEEEYVASVSAISPNVPGHLSPYVYRFADSDRAFGVSEYILLHPPEIELAVEGLFTGLEVSTGTHQELIIRKWRAKDVPATPDEPFGPPTQELLPWVTYGFGVDWQTVGDNLRNRLIPVVRPTQEIRLFAEEHLEGETTIDQLRSLVSALLLSVEDGNGPLDLGVSAGSALSRGQGNRLGVLAALLLSADWEVDLALTRPAPFAKTHLAVPSADAFTLPLLRVRRDSSEIWVDLHEEVSGVGHISPILQGSDALMVPLTGSNADVFLLSELPTFANPNLQEHTTLEATIDARGDAEIVFTMWLRDAQAARFAENLRSVPPDRVDTVFGRLAASLFPGAENVRGEVNHHDERLEVRFIMDLPGACEVQGASMECRGFNAATPLAPALASLPERRQPLVLQIPILRLDEVIIQPPPGWTSDRPARRLSTPWGQVDETVETIGGRRRSTLVLEIPAVTVRPQDYPDFARFCRAIDELISRPPRFER
ncbi:MAG: hypothetical protein DRJ65_21725 [Acidobacteria bacterium]|nr:MAG: hypothetical protein DRJ65_21725 [Acidobacteriota bacterium]